MSSHPEFALPDASAIDAAVGRALSALADLFTALSVGEHSVSLVVERTDGTILRCECDVSLGIGPLRVAVLDEAEFCALRALLVLALEGSTTRRAVLVATTAAEPLPRSCGWTVHDGWLHPMGADALQQAVMPCPSASAVLLQAYDAPALLSYSGQGGPS
ncbi:hypothetical protein [Streptomyces spectabilis]|uniref:Uncharacterized protein n=1 Tax=Streptomyces spectabilis TaxID=68270 RepID=A0A7W8EYV6_STRST|nr:hypothetical protein [Streptomyces spectabilis]MBB5109301.1 hypothetical protein [Streptomyces spectabilis]GGV52315.1 hypothetical protein GCM10010245_82290 [Streptomyces spectabilis]